MNVNNVTALQAAQGMGHVEMVRVLAELGANVNTVDIHHIAERGQVEMVKVLYELGADVHAPNKYGNTPLEHVKLFIKGVGTMEGHEEVVSFLSSLGE